MSFEISAAAWALFIESMRMRVYWTPYASGYVFISHSSVRESHKPWQIKRSIFSRTIKASQFRNVVEKLLQNICKPVFESFEALKSAGLPKR